MKKLIILIVIVVLAVWGLQNYTNFKALDYAKSNWQKVIWSKIGGFFNIEKEPAPDPEKQLNIFIRDSKYLPNFNAVSTGIKVTWINEDTKIHTVSGDNWGSGEIAPGRAWSRTFDVAGDYKYKCSLQPEMTGEIIVE